MKCIYLKPSHPKLELIQELRLKYDPLAKALSPHITVVFPFLGNFVLKKLLAITEKTMSSRLLFSLGSPVLAGDYFYFPVEQGREEIVKLHDELYAQLPLGLLSHAHPFQPHLTFGRLRQGQDEHAVLSEACRIFSNERGTIETLIFERIGSSEESFVEYEHKFNARETLS